MAIKIRQSLRDLWINGQKYEGVDLSEAPLDDLRAAINQEEIVNLTEVMRRMKQHMHTPHHATPYDFSLYVQDAYKKLRDDIAHERVEAYTEPPNSHFPAHHYVRVFAILDAFDQDGMPAADDDEPTYSLRKDGVKNPGNDNPLDFRRAVLVAAGEATPSAYMVKTGALVKYKERTPEEWTAHRDEMKRLTKEAKPITDGMTVLPAADRFHKWLVEKGISYEGEMYPEGYPEYERDRLFDAFSDYYRQKYEHIKVSEGAQKFHDWLYKIGLSEGSPEDRDRLEKTKKSFPAPQGQSVEAAPSRKPLRVSETAQKLHNWLEEKGISHDPYRPELDKYARVWLRHNDDDGGLGM